MVRRRRKAQSRASTRARRAGAAGVIRGRRKSRQCRERRHAPIPAQCRDRRDGTAAPPRLPDSRSRTAHEGSRSSISGMVRDRPWGARRNVPIAVMRFDRIRRASPRSTAARADVRRWKASNPAQDRQFALWVEEVQSTLLGQRRTRSPAGNSRLGRDAGDGDAVVADLRLRQYFEPRCSTTSTCASNPGPGAPSFSVRCSGRSPISPAGCSERRVLGHRWRRPQGFGPEASTVMVLPSLRNVTSMKFIAGAPMKPATNLLAGLL